MKALVYLMILLTGMVFLFSCTNDSDMNERKALTDDDVIANSDADSDSDSDTDSDADSDSDTDADTDIYSDTDSDTDTDSDADSGGDTDGDTDTDGDSDGDGDSDSDSDTDSDSDPDPDADSENELEGMCTETCVATGQCRVLNGTYLPEFRCPDSTPICCEVEGMQSDSDSDTDGDTDGDADADTDSDKEIETDSQNEIDTEADTLSNAKHHKFVGNITTGYNHSVDYNGLRYADYWDQITPENAGKWGSVEPQAHGERNWGALDAMYAYAQDNGIIFKQHAFVWGAQEPGNSQSLQEADVKSWMTEFCSRYPQTKIIDVVNEPPPHTEPKFANNIGGGTNSSWTWISNSFKWARDACPGAILVLNDYNNIEWTNDNQHIINIVNTIKDAGTPIDAIGAQAHDLDPGMANTSTMKTLINKLHNDTGLPIYITEYDISTSDDNAQLNIYQEQIPFFMETEWIHGITLWGWIYGQTWSLASESGLVRNGSSRPAMRWLMETLDRPAP